MTDSGPYTLFAPDDAAFKKLPAGALDALLKDKTKLQGEMPDHKRQLFSAQTEVSQQSFIRRVDDASTAWVITHLRFFFDRCSGISRPDTDCVLGGVI